MTLPLAVTKVTSGTQLPGQPHSPPRPSTSYLGSTSVLGTGIYMTCLFLLVIFVFILKFHELLILVIIINIYYYKL